MINTSAKLLFVAFILNAFYFLLLKYFNSSWYLPLCIYVNNISVEFYWFNNILDPDLSIIDLVFSTTYPVSNSKNVVSLVWNNWQKN